MANRQGDVYLRFEQVDVPQLTLRLGVEMEGCEDERFKQRAVTECLTAERIPPININRYMHSVYGDNALM